MVEVIEYASFDITTFGLISVSLKADIVNLLFVVQCECVYILIATLTQIFSGKEVTASPSLPKCEGTYVITTMNVDRSRETGG